ncbi:MAG: hypothetical protein WC528_04130 [Patescibacteria group bacterium]
MPREHEGENPEESFSETDRENEKEISVTLSRESTFADLYRLMENHENSEELKDLFDQELIDNFGQEIVDEVMAFEESANPEAAKTKVIDFFVERGYEKGDIIAYLPVEFK